MSVPIAIGIRFRIFGTSIEDVKKLIISYLQLILVENKGCYACDFPSVVFSAVFKRAIAVSV